MADRSASRPETGGPPVTSVHALRTREDMDVMVRELGFPVVDGDNHLYETRLMKVGA